MKIAICFPTHDHTKALFTFSLAALALKAAASLPHDIRIFHGEGSLPDIRNVLAEAALEWGADYQLCLDADQVFPDDLLHRLLAHDLDIVGCNYPQRRRPTGAPTARLNREPVQTTAESPPLQEVDSIGFGACLIRTEVYRRMPEPWFTLPLLGTRHGGEDIAFCTAARSAGFKVHVDHALSMEVGHIGEAVYRFG